MTGSRVLENARILWRTPSALGNEYDLSVDIKPTGILPWQRLLYSSSQEAYMPSACFSYSADVPPDTGTRNAVQPDPPDLRRMPTTTSCFRYEADVPLGAGNRGAAPSAPPGPLLMPLPCFSYPYICFSYPSDVPPGTRNRNAAQQDRLGLRRMPGGTCFRY
jgi:hypothetical protein